MVEAEFLAFEILTLASSYLSTTHLAAQSVLGTLTSITYQIPFPISIAASTRIANLIGATLSGAAKTSAKVALVAAALVGLLNMVLLMSLRNYIPQLFTNDSDVADMVAKVLPLCAAFQLFDALASNCHGILRGLGRQEIGGWVNLFFYYAVSGNRTLYDPKTPIANTILLGRSQCLSLLVRRLASIGDSSAFGAALRWRLDCKSP
jgi:multidrug resistance protein, MATE family